MARRLERAALAFVGAALAGCVAGPPACPDDQVQDAESGACVAERCGAEPWGTLERGSDTIHVAPWGSRDGDGSEAEPFDAIQDGVHAAGAQGGGIVAVGAGTYRESLELGAEHGGVQIFGRCAELVVLDGSDGDAPGYRATEGEVGLHGLTVTGASVGLWVAAAVGATVEARVSDVVLRENHQMGVFVSQTGAVLRLDRSTVSGTLPDEDGLFGRGIGVESGGRLVGRELLIEGNRDRGIIAASANTSVELLDVEVRDTQPASDGTAGRGVEAVQGARLVADRVQFVGNHEMGLHLRHAGTTVELLDSDIRDTRPGPSGIGGAGILVLDGAALSAQRLRVEDNLTAGITVAAAGSSADLLEVDIRRTQPAQDGTAGRGIQVEAGGAVFARDLDLSENHAQGIIVRGQGASADLRDTLIVGTRPTPDGQYGWGALVVDGAELVADGLVLESNHGIGLFVFRPGSAASLSGTVIRNTQPSPDGTGGRGINIQDGATLVASDLALEGNREIGIFAMEGGSTLELVDVTVRDTLPSLDGSPSAGVLLQMGATLDAEGLVLEGNASIGLAVTHEGTVAVLRDSFVRDTRSFVDGPGGRGISVQDGGRLTGHGLTLERNRDVGLFAADASTVVDVTDLQVRDTRPRGGDRFGIGIGGEGGPSFVIDGLLAEGNNDAGIALSGLGTSMDLHDATIRATRSAFDTAGGTGVTVQRGATLNAVDVRVEDNEGPGLYVVAGGELHGSTMSMTRNGFAGAIVIGGELAVEGGAISASVPHAAEGGGLGVFGWNWSGPFGIELRDVEFTELAGPAGYLRGQGRAALRGCEIVGGGTAPWLPGGVFAVDGLGPWITDDGDGTASGLLLAGNTFRDMQGDAVLLDGASATFAVDDETGLANSFTGIGGAPLMNQRCGESAPVEVLDGSAVDASCQSPVPLGPLLEYLLRLSETGALE